MLLRRLINFQRQIGSVPSRHHSLFSVHMLFLQFWGGFICGFFATTRTPTSPNHSYLHYSLCKFTGEWFTNHSNHIHRFTLITRIVATKFQNNWEVRVIRLTSWVSEQERPLSVVSEPRQSPAWNMDPPSLTRSSAAQQLTVELI